MSYTGKLADNNDILVYQDGKVVGEDFFTKVSNYSYLNSGSFAQMNVRQIRKMNTSNSPVALYTFDGHLSDSVGSAHFTRISGVIQYIPSYEPGKRAISFTGSQAITASGATLAISGNLTMLLHFYPMTTYTGSSGLVITYAGVGETQATNILYEFTITNANKLSYLSEWASGTNNAYQFQSASFLPNQPMLVGLTRTNSTGIHKLYVGGYQIDQFSGPFPDGGTSNFLFLGCNQNGGNDFTGVFEGVKLFNYALTDAQMFEEARQIYSTDIYNPVTIVQTTAVANNVTGSSRIIFTSTAAGNVTQSLFPPVSGANFIIKKITTDANNIALKPYASELIDGVAGIYVLSGSTTSTKPAYNIVSDGVDWWIL